MSPTKNNAVRSTGILLALLIMVAHNLADSADIPIGDAVNELPIFDAHIHYKEPAWSQYSVKNIVELMDKNGVAMGLVSSTPDEGTIMLWQYAPNRIVPELRPYHGNAGSSNWAKVSDMETYLNGRLEKYPHEGIGEFHIHNLDATDAPFFIKVIEMAKERDISLHVHSGTEPIRWLYSLDSEVKIIWAHAGLSEPASEVHSLLSEFSDLYTDLSLREFEILGSDLDLDAEWKEILFDFQDRLMVGSDTWVNSQWDRYSDIIRTNRIWLSKLPRDVAEKIAYKNAERLFDRKISMDQIGTK